MRAAASRRTWRWVGVGLALACHAAPADVPAPVDTVDTVDVDSDTPVDDTPVVVDPGPPGVRGWRVHRAFYRGVVADLFGVDVPVHLLPEDPVYDGFDDLTDALTIADADAEAWMGVAEDVARQVVARPDVPTEVDATSDAVERTDGVIDGDGVALAAGGGTVVLTLQVPVDGVYDVVVVGSYDAPPPVPRGPWMWIDDRAEALDVLPDARSAAEGPGWVVRRDLEAGPHLFRLQAVLNGNPAALHVRAVRATLTDGEGVTNPAWTRLAAVCIPDDDPSAWEACARQLFVPLASRAWGWPATDDDAQVLVDGIVAAHASGSTWSEAVEHAIVRLLMSPHFLVRLEPSGSHEAWGPSHVAARLARFLWSSVPDDALIAAAAQATDASWVRPQAERMLADPRAAAFVTRFTGQWLWTQRVAPSARDATLHPAWNEALTDAMVAEVEALFTRAVDDDLPVTDLLLASRGHVQAPLDALYGLPGPGDDVDLSGVDRGGVLGMAGVLAATSQPARTSVVRRGAWVLSQLLCDPPEPPPADIPRAPDVDDPREAANLHQTNPSCIACHAQIDPMGLALEHFDEIGAWRTAYPSGALVDASATLPGGVDLYGARELAAALAADDRFGACVVRQLATYGLGRSPADAELTDIDPEAGGLRGVLLDLVTSDAFLHAVPEPR
ncbi:MAG: DUF1588 domain-containing protein [Alphaproteobacteria bacterium]|nr:DUF1588 domain-containing protein [Alphaproteobacteria bacterium]